MAGGVYNLNAGVNIKTLFPNATEEQIKEIENMSNGGFTEDEIRTLEEKNIDKSLIINNSTKTETVKKTQNADAVTKKAQEIKEKYCSNLEAYTGDKYNAKNPELAALNQAMTDGVILALGEEGFTKTQILHIVNTAFPTLGIKPTGENGAYDRPYGHGAEAKEIYSKFTSQLLLATGMDTEEIKAAKAKLAQINNQISTNNRQLQILECTIMTLQYEVEEQLTEAIEESKDIQEESKKQAQEKVKENLNKYTNAEGKMTYEEFQNGIESDLGDIQTKSGRKLSAVIIDIVNANFKMQMLKGYVQKFGDLKTDNENLSLEAQETKAEVDRLVQEAAEKASMPDEQANCTDPIGFTTGTERYDFFMDTDGNGDITNEQEFLGATNGFKELLALNTNNDNTITADELEGVKVVKTNTDGTQEILNASDIFKNETDGINIASYKSQNKDIGEGNTLLGTFDVSFNGQNMQGYQTLDSNEWLDKNYEFTDEVNGTGRFSQDNPDIVAAYDVEAQFAEITKKQEDLEGKLTEANEMWGISQDFVDRAFSENMAKAETKAETIRLGFEKVKREDEKMEEQLLAKKEEELKEELKELKELEEKEEPINER